MSHSEPGFTLLEVVTALAVVGLVLAGIGQELDFTLWVRAAQGRWVNQHADLDAGGRLLRGLIARMGAGSVDSPPSINGTASTLAFTTELPAAVDAGMRRADVVIWVDPAQSLVLRWTPHRHAVSLTQPAQAAEVVLLDHVQRVSFAYLPPPPSGQWGETWSAPYPPRLIRLHIEFPPNDQRRWPDIVAVPAQARPHE